MRFPRPVVLIALLAAGPAGGTAAAQDGLLRTLQPLDEARGYCLDIGGSGANARLDEPLQVHTCKYGAPLEDQRFGLDGSGAIKAVMYDRCLAAGAFAAGGALRLQPCATGAAQRWVLAGARLSPASHPDLCVTVGGTRGEPAGTPLRVTPVYQRRPLTLERCDATRADQQAFRWSLPGERALSAAETARQGMPPEIASQLAAFYRDRAADINPRTYKLYAGQARVYDRREITMTKGMPYGPHERQQLDIHTAAARRSAQPVPVVLVFHGGGLVGGSRDNTANVADYFASLGYVGVNGGYRLAPESRWPEGARDVGSAVTWLQAHAAEYGGDPSRIFVVGISTGALHTAMYAFRPELLPPNTARAAGVVLVSGPYTFDFDAPTKGELAYFGEDRSRWADMVVTGHVTRADIPALFTTAEWDEPRYVDPFSQLFRELVGRHHVSPRYRQSLGHNHVSQLASVGTTDTSVSREILDFIDRVLER